MAELENVKWRYYTEEEKQAIREEFKKLDDSPGGTYYADGTSAKEDEDDDPDDIIDWKQVNLDTAYKVIGKITLQEFAKIHSYVFRKR